jgi:hypothetical protein
VAACVCAAVGERCVPSTGATMPRPPPHPQAKPWVEEFLWRAMLSHLPPPCLHHHRQPRVVTQLHRQLLRKLLLATKLLLDLSGVFPNHQLKLAQLPTTASVDLIVETRLQPPYGPADPTTSPASTPCAPTSTLVPPSTYCPTLLIVPPPTDARHGGQPHW